MELSEAFRLGMRGLEGLPGVEIVDEVRLSEGAGRWAFPCRLTADLPDGGLVPETTTWWVLVEPTYPAGGIEIYPAAEDGITETHPHQSFNGPPRSGKDRWWRRGLLCHETPIATLRRAGFTDRPVDADVRLAWTVRRAQRWLELAARGGLLPTGDRFELPDFRFGDGGPLAIFETAERLATWERSPARVGYADVFWKPAAGRPVHVVGKFVTADGEVVLPQPAWSAAFAGRLKPGPPGIWLHLDEPPILHPWQAPSTWAELEAVFQREGIDVEATLLPLLEPLRRRTRHHTRPHDVLRHPLLIGFPIPKKMGCEETEMHWVGLLLPLLSACDEAAPGFRTDAEGRLRRDLLALREIKELPWFATQSWTDGDLTGRGRLPPRLADSKVALIGAGALGSSLAELLVRGGVRRLVVVDKDRIEAGNLVRHTATLDDLGKNKAAFLARRASTISPYVEVTAIETNFPPEKGATEVESLRAADVVIDATADDAVLSHLERFDWGGPKRFFSLSLSLHARRLYAFTAHGERFPHRDCVTALTRLVEADLHEADEDAYAYEGLGCWNPVFPADHVAVSMLAAAGVELLLEVLAGNETENQTVVFERVFEEGRFQGIERWDAGAEE